MVVGLEWVRIRSCGSSGDGRQWTGAGRCRRGHGIVSGFQILHVGMRVGRGEWRREYPSSTPVEEEVRTGDLRPNSAPQEGEA